MTIAEHSPRDALLDAALVHVAFDGWSEATFRGAIADTGINPNTARALFPRGAVDLAAAFHKRGDSEMVKRLKSADLEEMKFRDRVAYAVRTRLEVLADIEAVRRGVTLFSLPMHAPEGARLIWGTADAIWTALGDTSQDANWYTKRATLSAVYSATVLYWLGDESPGHADTWAFLDRRIENVMQIEKAKAAARKTPGLSQLMSVQERIFSGIRAPSEWRRSDLPGRWGGGAK